MKRVIAHFLRDGVIREVDYWEVERRGKEVAYLKVFGSERPCWCENQDAIRLKILARINGV